VVRLRKALVAGACGMALATSGLLWAGGTGFAGTVVHQAHRGGFVMYPQIRRLGFRPSTRPLTEQYCKVNFGTLCYGPTQLQTAYDMQPLYREGFTGRGETIVIVDAFSAPTIRRDLTVFDTTYGLTAPPRFTILKWGAVPAFTPSSTTMINWAGETSLDVEYAHAMAPGANILLVELPSAGKKLGITGIPTIVDAENYVIDHHLGSVITQSFGVGEATFTAPSTILGLRSAFENAYRNGVTVLASAGDTGVTQVSTATGTNYFPYRDVGWPASDPLVTAVGGTQLTLSTRGRRTAADQVWDDTTLFGFPAATTGGISTVFTRPSYQNGVAGVVGNRRGVPDISMSAACTGAVNVYLSLPTLGAVWTPTCGTSEASPLFAGIVAIADQMNGHKPLGMINPAIYAMGAAHEPGIVQVTTGNNAVFVTTHGKHVDVPGYTAGPGYNLATGLGTVTGPLFVRELVQAVHRVGTTVTYGFSSTFLPHG
jgi:subtilase family serine protease